MSAEAPRAELLDWRELAPPREHHECDCRLCDLGGDLEPPEWPTLVHVEGQPAYITDRFVAIRADLAPVPESYEGPVLPESARVPESWQRDVTDTAPTGVHFRWHVLKALEVTGWRLRLLAEDAPATRRPRLVGVVTTAGEHIGWAVSASASSSATREYVEEADRG